MTTDLATETPIYDFTKERDQYGRTVRHAVTPSLRTLAVIVNLPKVYVRQHPGRNYLVNIWAKGNEVTYHATLNAAKAYLFEALRSA